MVAAVAPQGGRVGALVGIRCQGERRAPSARPQKKGRRHAFTVSPVHDRRKAPISTTQAERRTASCSAFSHLEAWGCATSCVGRSTHGGDAGTRSTCPGSPSGAGLPRIDGCGARRPLTAGAENEDVPNTVAQTRRLRARNVPLSHTGDICRARTGTCESCTAPRANPRKCVSRNTDPPRISAQPPRDGATYGATRRDRRPDA